MAPSLMDFSTFDWKGEGSFPLVNPRSPNAEKLYHSLKTVPLKGHFFVATSGSTGEKWVALSKEAVLHSALAVNQSMALSKKDVWVNPLPDFHVGGMGIWARCYLASAKVADYKKFSSWDPEKFIQFTTDTSGTVTSLVPTMLYDLVVKGYQAPPSLRYAVIGGGKLEESLAKKALTLGWKVAPSYGLTECASQVATAEVGGNKLHILNHIELVTDRYNHICIKSPSLLTAYIYFSEEGSLEIVDPKKGEWLTTSDRGILIDHTLEVWGRESDFVKIGGEGVMLGLLQDKLLQIREQYASKVDMELVALNDERLGAKIVLVVTSQEEASYLPILTTFQESVMPYARIREVIFLPTIPRSATFKVLKNELRSLLSSNQSGNPKE